MSQDLQAPPDVRLLIDISGSMRESDPDNLRIPALELMVNMLPDNARAGVWTFGQWVNMVVKHRDIDEKWRRQAMDAVSQISNRGLLTNIPEVLQLATFDRHRLDGSHRVSLILLTDGKVEVSESPTANAAAARRIIEVVAAEYRQLGIQVHTIALSDEADWEFLQLLARETGGTATRIASAGELTAVFLRALDSLAPSAQVPLADNRFLIDPAVSEFTVLVLRGAGDGAVALVDPEGLRIETNAEVADLRWYGNSQFELITVQQPLAGEWLLEAPPDSTRRVMVVADLTLEVDRLPATIPAGRSTDLGIRLRQRGRLIQDPEFLQLLEITVAIVRNDDRQWQLNVADYAGIPDSGEFRVALDMLREPGVYELVITVDGKTFQRETQLRTEVVAAVAAGVLDTRATAESPPVGDRTLLAAALLLLTVLGGGYWVYRTRHRRRPWTRIQQHRDHPTEPHIGPLGDP